MTTSKRCHTDTEICIPFPHNCSIQHLYIVHVYECFLPDSSLSFLISLVMIIANRSIYMSQISIVKFWSCHIICSFSFEDLGQTINSTLYGKYNFDSTQILWTFAFFLSSFLRPFYFYSVRSKQIVLEIPVRRCY